MAIDTGGRPLSPHLQVYRPQLTSLLSITHRATGVALSVGTLGLVYWLMALATGAAEYAEVQACYGSILGRLMLFGWSYALFFHLCNGVRHLIWDTGQALEIDAVYRSGWIMLAASFALTVIAWIAVAL
jgi:succinate dehydrogenase / fumarate reductase cytochrome b subunit